MEDLLPLLASAGSVCHIERNLEEGCCLLCGPVFCGSSVRYVELLWCTSETMQACDAMN